ncbi:MAG: hypothetical protein J7M05_00355, partial [Anaerolineae bacterium]|nr:hypothetical protein [Anaerolineae bacterium]
FAAMNGVPMDVEEACAFLASRERRVVDIGQIIIDGRIRRYFDNTVGIGFDGLVVKETRRYKRLRGMALYLPVVLRTIFLTLEPVRARIVLDGREFWEELLMIIVSNGPREGRTFLVAPNARCDDGQFDLITVGDMPRLEMLAMVPRFIKGSHLSHRLVNERRGRHIIIESEDPLHVHVDGEILCEEAHRIEVKVLPSSLVMVGRGNHSGG